MPIRIPLEVHAISVVVVEEGTEEYPVQVGRETRMQRRRVTTRREVPPRQDRASFDRALGYSNSVFTAADVQFVVASFDAATDEIPGGGERVDVNGFQYLARVHPPRSGLSVLLVGDFERGDLGGQAVEAQSVCIVCALGDPGTGKVLAHELGHLLDLPHVARDAPRSHWNLMYEAYRAGDELTADQVARARGSRTGRRFGGP